jgi:hypothetical protein
VSKNRELTLLISEARLHLIEAEKLAEGFDCLWCELHLAKEKLEETMKLINLEAFEEN